jgi:hypothetical protein
MFVNFMFSADPVGASLLAMTPVQTQQIPNQAARNEINA